MWSLRKVVISLINALLRIVTDESRHSLGHELPSWWSVLHGAEENFSKWTEPLVV